MLVSPSLLLQLMKLVVLVARGKLRERQLPRGRRRGRRREGEGEREGE
jgi:hypothetical protein